MKKQKRYSPLKKTGIILMALATLGPFSSCQKQENQIDNDITKESKAIYEVQETARDEQITVQTPVSQTKEITLEDINPKFSPYLDNLAMDDESVLKIIKIAMDDAQEFYKNMGAPNMKYDKNLKVITGDDNFYPDWMNEYFYMGKAMAESSFRVDVVTDIKSNPTENDAQGILQICPQSLKTTLQEYYKNIFGVSVDLSGLEVVPSKQDLDAALYSKEAQQNIVKAVYNNIYLAICYDIYNAKCLNPISHQDYYANYGGFSEDVRRLATIGLYGTRRDTVLSGLKAGDLEERLRNISDMDIYLNNISRYEKNFKQKYQSLYENQPGM